MSSTDPTDPSNIPPPVGTASVRAWREESSDRTFSYPAVDLGTFAVAVSGTQSRDGSATRHVAIQIKNVRFDDGEPAITAAALRPSEARRLGRELIVAAIRAEELDAISVAKDD